ncbi:MAG: hypothetical protein GC145_16300 [Caulobacter sp.]|nr:hypothetical protein [Caulobacter sp.]
MIRSLASLLMAVALSAAAPALARQEEPTSKRFALSPDQVWTRTVRFLAANGVSPSSLDRSGGTIMAEGPTQQGAWVACPKMRGVLRNVSYRLSIVIDPADDGGAVVTVLMNGEGESAKRRRFLVIPTGMRRTALICPSTGTLEYDLFKALSAAE